MLERPYSLRRGLGLSVWCIELIISTAVGSEDYALGLGDVFVSGSCEEEYQPGCFG
jgi:hypothetical protein